MPRCCERCRSPIGPPRDSGASFLVRGAVPDALAELLCDRCGAVLPMVDSYHVLLHKLSLLSRFGLVAEARPILGPTRGDR